MGIGLTEEHEALAASVRGFAERHVTPQVVRAVVNEESTGRPAFWSALAEQGLLGLHLPEEYGGQGSSLVELAVAVEEAGRALVPGPYVPTVLASALILASSAAKARDELLPDLATGVRTATVSLATGLTGRRDGSDLVVSGTVSPVLDAGVADILVLPVSTDEGEEWVAVQVDPDKVTVTRLDGLDVTRPVASVTLDGVTVPADRILDGLEGPEALNLATVVLGAEACGVAGWAVDTATRYAKLREQFGRPIGQFQGVKHLCARMLIALEQARAVVWDAARAFSGTPGADEDSGQIAYAAAVAAVVAPDAAVKAAEGCIQVHGGIGYTWEHDAHLYYRRALTLRALLGRVTEWRASVADLALSGADRPTELELPAEAEPLRAEIRSHLAELAALEQGERIATMVADGWAQPHLPAPWGRDASPLEQVLIQKEMTAAGLKAPALMIGAWVVPSVVQYGTPEQKERFLPPTLRGEIIWCQLFSEPGAGSDLASLTTRAEKVEGGWRISGQKIWTSLAQFAQWGICIARTDPSAPKHDGITYFLVDMKSEGIEVRPLRELSGEAIFNEVFLDGVFVPDEMVVGPVNEGWRVARNTLANERVGLKTYFQLGADLPQLLALVGELGVGTDPVVRDNLGRLISDEQALQLLGLRATIKQLSGTDPGATVNVRKLVAMEHHQKLTEYGFTLLGAEGALTGGPLSELRRKWTRLLLACRAMTIGGGTTEVSLNIIGERILGLPRDPEPGR